jgi:hypothetical protein
LGNAWRDSVATGLAPSVSQRLNELWQILISAGTADVEQRTIIPLPDWSIASLELMAIADCASVGIGFEADSPFSKFLFDEHWRDIVQEPDNPAPVANTAVRSSRTTTLCILVPPGECCVQPKSRTPQVGCTLRSLSHHLALLPGTGEVTTKWLMRPNPGKGPLNLLLVPYPFRMDGRAFTVASERPDEKWGRFGLEQTWLPNREDPKKRAEELASFFCNLVKVACKEEVTAVHGLVLPETALDQESAILIADELARETSLEFFVSGVLAPSEQGAPPRNKVLSFLFEDKSVLTYWEQSKHHRWKLERHQIARYHLGHTLDPELDWWENIDISNREVTFYLFRDGASLAVLVCEDLARIDPVQPVVRAVGPNLVIALLMDGPQLEKRWSARYATVLADDPGSSVLTFTSLGGVQRSARPGEDPREIALFKDSSGVFTELRLPQGKHGLVLTLSSALQEERTLDRRSDQGATVRYSLTGVRAITALPLPTWI